MTCDSPLICPHPIHSFYPCPTPSIVFILTYTLCTIPRRLFVHSSGLWKSKETVSLLDASKHVGRSTIETQTATLLASLLLTSLLLASLLLASPGGQTDRGDSWLLQMSSHLKTTVSAFVLPFPSSFHYPSPIGYFPERNIAWLSRAEKNRDRLYVQSWGWSWVIARWSLNMGNRE